MHRVAAIRPGTTLVRAVHGNRTADRERIWPKWKHLHGSLEGGPIRERVKAGLERARAQGKTLGRPRTAQSVEKQIRAARQQGKGIKRIANELGVGVSTVQRVAHEPRPQVLADR